MDEVAPAPNGNPQKVTGESGEQQGLQWLAMGTYRPGKRNPGEFRQGQNYVCYSISASFLVSALSLFLSLSLKTSFLCCLHASGPDLAAPVSASSYSHASAWKRLIASASLFHLPRRQNPLAWFKPGVFTLVQLTVVIEAKMVHRSTTECRVLACECNLGVERWTATGSQGQDGPDQLCIGSPALGSVYSVP